MKEMSESGPDLEEASRKVLDKKVSRRVFNVSGAKVAKASVLVSVLATLGVGAKVKQSSDGEVAQISAKAEQEDETYRKIDQSFQSALGDLLNLEASQKLIEKLQERQYAKRVVKPLTVPETGNSPDRIHIDKSLEYDLWLSQETADQSPDISATLNYIGVDVVSGTLWVHLQDGKISGPVQTAGWISQQDYLNKRGNPGLVGQEVNGVVKFPVDKWSGLGNNVIVPPSAPQGMFPVQAFVAQGQVDVKGKSISYEVHANNDLIIRWGKEPPRLNAS